MIPVFNKLGVTKVINLKENVKAMIFSLLYRVCEGKYAAFVNKDTILTEHWLDNLLTCLQFYPNAVMSVPSMPSTSNRQGMVAEFTPENAVAVAKAHNHPCPYLWEERCILMPVIALYDVPLVLQTAIFILWNLGIMISVCVREEPAFSRFSVWIPGSTIMEVFPVKLTRSITGPFLKEECCFRQNMALIPGEITIVMIPISYLTLILPSHSSLWTFPCWPLTLVSGQMCWNLKYSLICTKEG